MPIDHAPPGPHFAELLAALPVAVLVIGPDDRIGYANGEAELLLNFSERAMLGRPLDHVLTPPDSYGARRPGLGFAAYDLKLETKRAGRLRLDFVEAVIADHPGWRMITLHGGASARRIGQSARAAARAAIGAAAMLAHEIKNPLSGIRGAAQLIRDGADHDDLTQLIVTEVDRIAALIDRMQDFSDTRPLNPVSQNIYPILDHARRVALAGFARGIEIEEKFDPSLPPVMIDRDALLQVMLNLLKNAWEATRLQSAPVLRLTTAYRHGMAIRTAPDKPRRPLPIELCVIDNGPGAPADIAELLFDPFISGKPEGQGLGLALVDKLVRDMGGIVQYAREGDPEMTVFRVFLPKGTA